MRSAYLTMAEHVLAGDLLVNTEVLPLADVASAWKRQQDSPNTKLVLVP
jgi:hypothetical protein